MRIYKTKVFHKWAKSNKLTELSLQEVANEIIAGLIDAQLGGFLYKKRTAIINRGKRSGARIILAYKEQDKIVFLYGFKKNEKDNITNTEKEILNKLAEFYFSLNEVMITKTLISGELMEVTICDPRS